MTAYVQTIRDNILVGERTRRAGMLVICSSHPSARDLRRAWKEDPMYSEMSAEFVALPCGLRELTRVIAHALQKTDRHTNLATDVESSDSAKGYPVTPDDRDTYNRVSIDDVHINSLARPLAPSGYTEVFQPKMDVMASAVGGAEPSLEQLSSAFQNLSHASEAHTNDPQDPAITATLEQRPSEPPITHATRPRPNSPVVLLVDDNSINLQLLVRFAKKQKYEYITAVDGKLALEAFENAHRNSATPPSPDVARTISTSPGGVLPGVILMDINMPVVSVPSFS